MVTILEHPSARARSMDSAVESFLSGLEYANRSPHTRRAYASDLASFRAHYAGSLDGITADTLRGYFATLSGSSAPTRARKQASLASFLAWAYRQELIDADPMGKVERVRLGDPAPRGVGRELVRKVLGAIPPAKTRDRLLFGLIYGTGLRAGEALSLHVEDLDLSQDDERIRVLGKGNRRRTVLLDDPALVRGLRKYLKDTGYEHGALFRAEKNGRGGGVRYQSVQELWAGYCAKAGVSCTLHQLRHAHATELVNGGVSLETIRKRLGHKNLQTTLRYAEQSDGVSDAEIRAWRRRRQG